MKLRVFVYPFFATLFAIGIWLSQPAGGAEEVDPIPDFSPFGPLPAPIFRPGPFLPHSERGHTIEEASGDCWEMLDNCLCELCVGACEDDEDFGPPTEHCVESCWTMANECFRNSDDHTWGWMAPVWRYLPDDLRGVLLKELQPRTVNELRKRGLAPYVWPCACRPNQECELVSWHDETVCSLIWGLGEEVCMDEYDENRDGGMSEWMAWQLLEACRGINALDFCECVGQSNGPDRHSEQGMFGPQPCPMAPTAQGCPTGCLPDLDPKWCDSRKEQWNGVQHQILAGYHVCVITCFGDPECEADCAEELGWGVGENACWYCHITGQDCAGCEEYGYEDCGCN